MKLVAASLLSPGSSLVAGSPADTHPDRGQSAKSAPLTGLFLGSPSLALLLSLQLAPQSHGLPLMSPPLCSPRAFLNMAQTQPLPAPSRLLYPAPALN